MNPPAFCPCGVGAPCNFHGFTDDAKAAIAASPDYFVKWYTIKSILLVGVAAALAYTIGKGE